MTTHSHTSGTYVFSPTSSISQVDANTITWGPITVGRVDTVLLPEGVLTFDNGTPTYTPYRAEEDD
jgi:hypothetical protein